MNTVAEKQLMLVMTKQLVTDLEDQQKSLKAFANRLYDRCSKDDPSTYTDFVNMNVIRNVIRQNKVKIARLAKICKGLKEDIRKKSPVASYHDRNLRISRIDGVTKMYLSDRNEYK
jgi:hypothetical protein